MTEQKDQVQKTSWTAAAIARERLYEYLEKTLRKEWDESVWEFYTFLLEKAKGHRLAPVIPAYSTIELGNDEREARERNRALFPERF